MLSSAFLHFGAVPTCATICKLGPSSEVEDARGGQKERAAKTFSSDPKITESQLETKNQSQSQKHFYFTRVAYSVYTVFQ